MPAEQANVKLVIIWEHELRMAAKKLHELRALLNKDGKTEAEAASVGKAIMDTFNVCAAALVGAEGDDVALVLSAVSPFRPKANVEVSVDG